MPVAHPQTPRLSLPGRIILSLTAVLLSVVVPVTRATAADNSWTNGAGTFVWNTTDSNWTAPTVWNNDPTNADAAAFGTTGVGTITLGETIHARSLNFSATGFTLTGGTLNLVNTGSGTLGAGTINVGGTSSTATATTATINSNLISTIGFVKMGDGMLVLSGTANIFTGFVPTGGGTGTGWGANILIGSATTTQYGGTLRLASADVLPAGTTVAIGRGVLDIGENDVILAGLTFTGTNPNVAYVPDRQGVVGTGTLTLTGPIRVTFKGIGWGNYINVPVSANGGTLRLESGEGQSGRGLTFLKPIGNGSLFKTFGVGGFGEPIAGGVQLLGNNTYTGTTTINAGLNTIAGTNASTDVRVVNATVSLLGPNGSYGSAETVRLIGGNVTLDDLSRISEGPSPSVPTGHLDNRLGTSAAATLVSATLQLQSGDASPINQSFGSLNAAAGSTNIELRARTGQTANLFVTGNLTIGATASLRFGGDGLQTTVAVTPGPIRMVVTGTLPETVNGVIPGLYGIGSTSTGFVRNSSTPGVGLVMLAPGDYSTNVFGPTLNVDLTTVQTLTASQSANAIRTSVNVTISAGNTLTVGAGGLLIGGPVTVAGPGTLAFGNNPGRIYTFSATTFSGPITGTAGLSRSGGGSVTLSGDLSGLSGGITTNGHSATLTLNTPTYAGPVHVVGGTLAVTADIGAGGAIALGTVETPAGTVAQAAILDINNPAAAAFHRDIVTVGSDGTAPFTAGFDGAWLRALTTAPQTVSGNIALGTHLTLSAGDNATTTLSGTITGAGGLHIVGGVVALTNPANTFQGGLQLSGGVAAATSDVALGTGAVRFRGGTLRTDYSGNFNRRLTVLTTGTFDTNGNNVTVAGPMGGENPAAVLTKIGAGTLTLTGTNPYPGTTAVNGGALAVAGGGSFGALGSIVSVNSGGTLAGTGAVNGVVAVNTGGTVRGDLHGGTGTLAVTGNATLNAATGGGGGIAVEVAGSAASASASHLSVGGVLNLAGLAAGTPTVSDPKFVITLFSNTADPLVFGETYSILIAETTQPGNIRRNGSPLAAGTVIDLNDYTLISSAFASFDNVELAVNGAGSGLVLTFTPVPEPTTVLGLATAVLGLALLRRRAWSNGRSV